MKQLNLESMQQAIKGNLVIIDFFAPWCGPCVKFAPTFEKLGTEFQNKADFYKVDIDSEQSVAAEYNIMSIPTLIVFKNGMEIERKFGSMSEIDFRIWLNSLFAQHVGA